MDERSEKRIITRISMSQDFRRKAQVPNLAVIEISQKLEFTNPLMNKKYYPQELGKFNSFLLNNLYCKYVQVFLTLRNIRFWVNRKVQETCSINKFSKVSFTQHYTKQNNNAPKFYQIL